MTIRGVVFDCDGVLCQTKRATQYYYDSVRSKLGLPKLTEEELNFVHVSTVEEGLRVTTPPEKLVAMQELVAQTPYLETVHTFMTSDPDIVRVLTFLKEHGCMLGVLSNGTQDEIHSLLRHCNLESYFDDILTCDIVAAKPNPEGLHVLAQRWRVALEEIVFVGDGMTDYGAAKMTTVNFIAFDNPKIPAAVHKENFSELLVYFSSLL